ncbi:DUF7379 domain-containing protein [Paracoccus rhizosphaerae]|uniref:CHAT domain-containing protein n=1 Tax=Paracoccus rhizosphaerae TaxID=1133347 RepID=A0ABV6CH47_9RHOB|nr:CHAT domain-containing protein [Paracoccus rhizosphaerae]
MFSVTIPGVKIPEDPVPQADGPSQQPFASVLVSSQRGTLPGAVTVDLPDEHVVEVTLENGIVLYRHAEALLSKGGPIVLPASFPAPNGTRGVGEHIVRLYRFFDGGAVSKAAVRLAMERIESKLQEPDALLRCRTPSDLEAAGAIADGQKMLILLHGTFSSTAGSFGNLALGTGVTSASPWERLMDAYRGNKVPERQVFAFEHRSLSKSPIENAIDLVGHLPRGAEVDLLSHSRGGLVGELLCRAARTGAKGAGALFDKTDRLILEAKHSGGELDTLVEQITELDRKLVERDLRIGSFVRVACPTRGTLLASERLDLYLSVLLNLLSLTPGPQQAFVTVMSEFVRAVVGSRTNIEALPGLQAMMPTAALIAMLNRKDLTLETSLDIVGGDIKAGGVLRALAVFATDLFYREDHDLVVNTGAMFGGAPRTTQPRALISRGNQIAHFNYFRNRDSVDRIVQVLSGKLPAPPRSASPELASVLRSSRGAGDRPVAIMLPGIMGSTLAKGDDLIWIDPLDLMRGGLRKVGADADGVPAPGVRPVGAVERYYLGLAQHVAKTHHTMIRQYDWRLSLDLAADTLAATINDALDATEQTKQPIRLICHSMGGLVARRLIVKHSTTWQRMHEGRSGSRVLMLGTPNGGSAAMAAGLIGRDKLIKQLALIDLKNSPQEILSAIVPLPGILELLPTDADFTYFRASTWEKLAAAAPKDWVPPSQDALNRARETWEGMELDPRDARYMLYIAGQAPATVTAIREEPFALLATPHGDGRVTWATGVLPGVATWYAPNVQHGDLARDRSLFQPITDLLLHGMTNRLPQTPPVSRDAEAVFELDEEPVIYPAGDDFDLLPMGGKSDAVLAEDLEPFRARVTIEHGDLRLQAGAVVVGHYDGAPLISAEKVLDDIFGGALRLHREAGIYPGLIGSSEMFYDSNSNPVGPDAALVVGLGPFGQLTPQSLKSTLTQGLVRFALRQPVEPGRKRLLTSLLIGHLDSRISVRESLRALLEALEAANRNVPRRMRIDELRILEVFEDRAIEASEALAAFAGVGRFDRLDIDPRLREGQEGRRRHSFGRNTEWEMIVEITCPEETPDKLCFRVMNRTALVDSHEAPLNRHALDHLMTGIETSRRTDSTVGRLLFRRLIPPMVRRVLSEGSNVTLVLDETAAAYPWELAIDKVDEKPIAIRTKLVRQLIRPLRPEGPRLPATSASLVIGDPKSYYAALPQAEKEARSVEKRLRSAAIGTVETSYGDDPAIEEKLFLTEPRLLHFAGHGVVNGGPDKETTGLVIGRDNYLTADDIRQLESVPEFVFLNCCHVARIGQTVSGDANPVQDAPEAVTKRSDLAANIAIAFMERGSKAVIAAGWAIDDGHARAFADTFYDRFLAGDSFAQAVQAARDKAHEAGCETDGKTESSDPTWGAYQCYGDSQYQLRSLGGLPPQSVKFTKFTARSQVLAALQVVRADARFARNQADADRLFETVENVEAAVSDQPEWARSPDVLEALGRALAEIGYRDHALAYLDEAIRTSPPTVSVETLELRDMLRVRKASEARWLAGDGYDVKALQEIERSQHENAIQCLQQHEFHARTVAGETPAASGAIRRLLRLGDTHLRFAAALASERAKTAFVNQLEKAKQSYGAAEGLIGGDAVLELAYARLRRTAATYFIMREEKRSAVNLLSDLDFVVASLGTVTTGGPVFERDLRLAEAQLLLLLVERRKSEPHDSNSTVAHTVEAFSRAFLGGATIGQREETVADLEALARLLARGGSNKDEAHHIKMIAKELRHRSLAPRHGGPEKNNLQRER